jgi:type IV pilus assembly protein PilC
MMGIFESFFAPRIGLKPLVDLCRRLSISLEAGIDIRKIWIREAAGGSWISRPRFETISDGVNRGDSLQEALERTGEFFPKLFREMIEVGEKTGALSEIFRRLADHYEHRLRTRRAFLAAITPALLQLLAALMIVGILIWIMGFLKGAGGQPIDLLGWGLTGNAGLLIYLAIVAAAFGVVALTLFAVSRGLAWTRPIQRLSLGVPIVGRCLRTIALSRMAWTLQLAMNVDMDLRHVLPLSLRSTGNDYYGRLSDGVVANVVAGQEIHEALRDTGCFPQEFLEVLEVGEMTGSTVESMGRLSNQYEERARMAVAALTVALGFAIWAGVALLIIFVIVRIFLTAYMGPINEALDMMP